ncbi:MAG: hypothetical protein IKW96_03645 [Ruminococcus sp.]|uniref:hypothetical protein n=1 Tax=Ruminococcus sp. TaxID=41978 RepID=UPI0025E546FB|nr:hypothetical protein [Ruminococcus sp.]MBR5682363.1 hypothetical protein [Ruminococcus sp.]
MNTLEIKTITTSKGYENDVFLIDKKPLHEYLRRADSELSDGLAITWNGEFENDGDARFMRFLLQKDKLNLPILSCPEDMDFSCTVIVADMEKTENTVKWKRIGRVNHSVESHKEQKEHGIVFVDTFSDDDWITYRDAAFLEVDSYEWREWISANWSEELYRRHINYTFPCYQNEENIDWLSECSWCFDRKEYEKIASSCRPRRVMDK